LDLRAHRRPDAKYFKSICRATIGPPSTVYYPYHGIYISLNFTFTSFGLHIPEGATVQLNDGTIKVNGVSSAGPVEMTVHFKAFPQGSGGTNGPPEFAVRAPYTALDALGPFEGTSVGNRCVYYFFMGIDDDRPNRMVSLPFDLAEGTIELPAMTINEERYERQYSRSSKRSILRFHPSIVRRAGGA
jgi:hypothetical protein